MDLGQLLLITLVAASLTTLATGLGALPFFFVPRLSHTIAAAFTGVAAGMMTSASLSQLLAEAMIRAPGWMVWQVIVGLAVGVFFFAFASRWVRNRDDFDVGGLRRTGGPGAILIVAVMTLHSLPEGIAIGVAFGAAADTGQLAFGASVALALAFHNVPEGVAISVALRGKNVSPWKCLGWSIVSSVPQPLGAVPAAAAVWLFEPLLPAGMGFSAGAMMYLVIEELLPDAYKRTTPPVVAGAFMAGLLVMLALGRLASTRSGGRAARALSRRRKCTAAHGLLPRRTGKISAAARHTDVSDPPPAAEADPPPGSSGPAKPWSPRFESRRQVVPLHLAERRPRFGLDRRSDPSPACVRDGSTDDA